MAKPKLPKRPKQSASITTLERHLEAIKKCEKEYQSQLAAAKKAADEKKKAIATRKSLNDKITKERAAYTRMK